MWDAKYCNRRSSPIWGMFKINNPKYQPNTENINSVPQSQPSKLCCHLFPRRTQRGTARGRVLVAVVGFGIFILRDNAPENSDQRRRLGRWVTIHRSWPNQGPQNLASQIIQLGRMTKLVGLGILTCNIWDSVHLVCITLGPVRWYKTWIKHAKNLIQQFGEANNSEKNTSAWQIMTYKKVDGHTSLYNFVICHVKYGPSTGQIHASKARFSDVLQGHRADGTSGASTGTLIEYIEWWMVMIYDLNFFWLLQNMVFGCIWIVNLFHLLYKTRFFDFEFLTQPKIKMLKTLGCWVLPNDPPSSSKKCTERSTPQSSSFGSVRLGLGLSHLETSQVNLWNQPVKWIRNAAGDELLTGHGQGEGYRAKKKWS